MVVSAPAPDGECHKTPQHLKDRVSPKRDEISAESLSPDLRRLFNRMRRLGYGTIRGLHVRSGDPLFDPPPRVVRAVRLAQAGPPCREPANADYALKREHLAFAAELQAIGNGVIDVVKVHDGLPVGLEISEQP